MGDFFHFCNLIWNRERTPTVANNWSIKMFSDTRDIEKGSCPNEKPYLLTLWIISQRLVSPVTLDKDKHMSDMVTAYPPRTIPHCLSTEFKWS